MTERSSLRRLGQPSVVTLIMLGPSFVCSAQTKFLLVTVQAYVGLERYHSLPHLTHWQGNQTRQLFALNTSSISIVARPLCTCQDLSMPLDT